MSLLAKNAVGKGGPDAIFAYSDMAKKTGGIFVIRPEKIFELTQNIKFLNIFLNITYKQIQIILCDFKAAMSKKF